MPTETIEQRIKRLRDIVEAGERAAVELSELQEMKRLMEKYQVRAAEQASSIVSQVEGKIAASAAMTVKDRILSGAESVLEDGKRRRPRELLEDMARIGVTVPGENPAQNLSSYLSREKDRFESDPGLGGWTLKRLTKKANPRDAATSQGFIFPTNGA